MRLAIISERLNSPIDEGVKKTAYNLMLELRKKHEVYAISGNSGGNLDHTSAFNLGLFFLNLELRAHLRKIKPDIIIYIPKHSCTFSSFIKAKILKLFSKNSKVVMLGLQKCSLNFILRRVLFLLEPDHLFVSSKACAQAFKVLKNVEFFYPGVDLTVFRPTENKTRDLIKRKYYLPGDKFIYLHVGHLKKIRNLDLLTGILGEKDLLLLIHSTSTKSESDILGKLSGNKNVRIIDGYIENISEIYQAVDCYVFPTTYHKGAIDIPLSILEAMSCDLPVITTIFGGLPDVLRDAPKEGFFYFKNYSELERCVRFVKQMDRAAIRTRQLVEKFSWKASAEKVIKTVMANG